jgi:hypothetical protein
VKTKRDVIEILNKGIFCPYETDRALEHLKKYKDDDALETIVKNISSKWAYYWAKEFPEDREIMRAKITESVWVYNWTCRFPEDREIMRKKITDEYWIHRYNSFFNLKSGGEK